MNRNLKVFGSALVAVFAMAVVASGVQAQTKVTVGSSPVWLTSEVIEHPTIGKAQTFKLAGGQTLSCEESSAVATVKNGDTSITVVPSFRQCKAVIGTESHFVTVTMNDCDFLGHGGVEVSGGTTFKEVEADLVCPTGKEVEIHVYKGAASETEELCTYKMAPFVNKGGGETHNVAGSPNDVAGTATVSGIALARTGSLLCGAASTTATATGSTTVKAFEYLGGAVSNGTVSELKEGNQVSLTASK